MRVLLTGKNGQLGRCVQEAANGMHNFELFAFDSKELDIADSSTVDRVFELVKPDIVINAAAYTAVDLAEDYPDDAFSVNAYGPKLLALAAEKNHIPIIHISTDYVFDGQATSPYSTRHKPSPQSVYGKSKLEGEISVQSVASKYIIFRTAWVFSEYGSNFVGTMIRLAKSRDTVAVVSDQVGCPTYAGDLAQAILAVCTKYSQNQCLPWGIYHYVSDAPISWYGFANEIFNRAHLLGVISKPPKLQAITTAQYPTKAKRPAYSVLDSGNLVELSIKSPSWVESLNIVLERISE